MRYASTRRYHLRGALAINAHGTAIPATNESPMAGQTYGSLSNCILSLSTIVWDETQHNYIIKTFDRADPDCDVLLTHLGRILIIEVTLQVMADQQLLCESFTDITIDTLCSIDSNSPNTFSSFLDKSGRVEVIWFPFTDKPWLKVWTVTPQKPLLAREVNCPYNYVFSDNIPKTVSDLANSIVSGSYLLTPLFGKTQYNAIVGGLALTATQNIWGWSKNLLHYIKPSTLRMTANGYAVLTNRQNIQQIIHLFCRNHQAMLDKYTAMNKYPINGPVEIRVTGLDTPT